MLKRIAILQMIFSYSKLEFEKCEC